MPKVHFIIPPPVPRLAQPTLLLPTPTRLTSSSTFATLSRKNQNLRCQPTVGTTQTLFFTRFFLTETQSSPAALTNVERDKIKPRNYFQIIFHVVVFLLLCGGRPPSTGATFTRAEECCTSSQQKLSSTTTTTRFDSTRTTADFNRTISHLISRVSPLFARQTRATTVAHRLRVYFFQYGGIF